jgi:hypothetical protein
MKKAYSVAKETVARFARWFVASVVATIVFLPVIASLSISE